MTLCALSKQPQIAFVLLELMVYPLKELRRSWNRVAIVVLPCLILSPIWVVAVSAEIAAWRLQLEESHPPEHFDPIWKLHYMWEHPGHFPLAVWRSLSDWGDGLWRELIGILGWQDIVLPTWTYLMLTILLLLVPLQKLRLARATRARVMVITGLTVLSYFAVVYLIFFLPIHPWILTMSWASRDGISLSFSRLPRSSSQRSLIWNCRMACRQRLRLPAR